jgi:hypothetical protein
MAFVTLHPAAARQNTDNDEDLHGLKVFSKAPSKRKLSSPPVMQARQKLALHRARNPAHKSGTDFCWFVVREFVRHPTQEGVTQSRSQRLC